MLKELCNSPLGSLEVDRIKFLTSFDTIDLLTGQTEEFRQIYLMEDGFPSLDFFDATPMLHHILIPGTFPNTEDVFALKKSLETVREILTFFKKKNEAYPLLKELTNHIEFFPEIIRAIDKIIDHQGHIRDNASPELADIRREITAKQSTVSRVMQRIIKQAQSEGWVDSGTSAAIRDGRAVIPVNATFKRKINGIIHDESSTGRTSYIEPAEIVVTNNMIRELQFAEQREIVKILTLFADRIRPDIPALTVSFEFLGSIDFIFAKARLAIKLNAVKPICFDQQAFLWKNALHPVMYYNFKREQREIVPLDIELTKDNRILLISGPNAGGKSVCLKTVGLIQYMFQCGLLVSVSENSEMGIFENICLDIGDEQSIDNDLSTYSSHLLNMKNFVRYANPRTMVLIDEFGSGTEPIIGGAIAESILNSLNNKGAWGVITTHYSNLKHFASETTGVINGAMLYDSHRMQPLFRLEIGKPGSSFAFEIARKIGMPEDILADAIAKSGQHVDFEKHLREIERDKRYWEQKREKIHKQEKRLEEITVQQLSELEKSESERKSIIENAKKQAQQILADSIRVIENTIRTIKENQAEKQKTQEARKELETFKEKTEKAKTEDEERILRKIAQLQERERRKTNKQKQDTTDTKVTPVAPPPEDKTIRKGDMVKVEGQETSGEVLEINGKMMTVAFGNLLSTLPANRLVKISKNELKKQTLQRNKSIIQVYNPGERRLRFKSSIDVRGMRTEEAIPKVEELVDEASMLNISEVRILHGKGNGILREMIRQYLSISPVVASYEDENIQQGGTGITIVKIK